MKRAKDRLTRRTFLRQTAAGLSSATILPAIFDLSNAYAATPVANPVTLMVFMRGGVDPLSVFPLLQAKATSAEWSFFAGARPNIRIQAPLALGTNKFGLHPSLTAIRDLWNLNQAALVMGAGSLNVTRSHFDQMAFVEGGDPTKMQTTGYLNRALAAVNPTDYILQAFAMQPAFDPSIPISLRGPREVQAVETIEDLAQLSSPDFVRRITLSNRVDAMFANGTSGCAALTNKVQRDLCSKGGSSLTAMSEAQKMLATISASAAVSGVDAYSPSFQQPATTGSLAFAMREAARCIQSQPKARFVTVDFGSLDTHQDQGSGTTARGGLDWRLEEFNQALTTFVADANRLGFWSRTTVVIVSEFGRTIRENATKGTDHGRGGLAMILGPKAAVGASKLLVPSAMDLQKLADPNRSMNTRNEVTDPFNALPVAYDIRTILSEVLSKRHGLTTTQLESVFPKFSALYKPLGLLV